MRREHFIGVIFVVAALIVLGIMMLSPDSLPISRSTGKAMGAIIFLLGMVVFLWILVYLKDAFRGTVNPVRNQLITTGPYHWIRHPLYLSMIIILLGIGIALRSLWGMVSIFVIFLPAVLYRAMLEEKALHRMFGNTWTAYQQHTKFLIPFIW